MNFPRKKTSGIRDKIIAVFCLCALALLSFRSASAQSLDIIGPSIAYQPSTAATRVGQAFQVKAVITDNEAIKEVVLFYRPTGKEGYLSLGMTREARGSHLYSAAIPQELVIEPRMDFYIQAVDTSGNTTFQGSSSAPLVVTVFPPQFQEQETSVAGLKAKEPLNVPEIKEPLKEPETAPPKTAAIPTPPKETPKVENQKEALLPAMRIEANATPKPSAVVKPFYKKGWFWGAVALVSGAVVVSQEKDASGPPSSTNTNAGSVTFTVPVP